MANLMSLLPPAHPSFYADAVEAYREAAMVAHRTPPTAPEQDRIVAADRRYDAARWLRMFRDEATCAAIVAGIDANVRTPENVDELTADEAEQARVDTLLFG